MTAVPLDGTVAILFHLKKVYTRNTSVSGLQDSTKTKFSF